MRDAGCVQNTPTRGDLVMGPALVVLMLPRVRKLNRLDAWRTAQELAYQAYLLTLDPKLSRHFALIDQMRRAALSVPANIAEGYALGTTPQFLRGLKIALGSNTELYSHLTVLARLDLVPSQDVRLVIDLCNRVIAMTIGLIRKLSLRPS
jgi:four helix bundle protein